MKVSIAVLLLTYNGPTHFSLLFFFPISVWMYFSHLSKLGCIVLIFTLFNVNERIPAILRFCFPFFLFSCRGTQSMTWQIYCIVNVMYYTYILIERNSQTSRCVISSIVLSFVNCQCEWKCIKCLPLFNSQLCSLEPAWVDFIMKSSDRMVS